MVSAKLWLLILVLQSFSNHGGLLITIPVTVAPVGSVDGGSRDAGDLMPATVVRFSGFLKTNGN